MTCTDTSIKFVGAEIGHGKVEGHVCQITGE